ncbi:MAG: hypothetical protein J4F29_25885, partial [Candidatus Latescibacteria bacterium]|nr:hypothetical protein [Candidatus Latescibacterota bacterium]
MPAAWRLTARRNDGATNNDRQKAKTAGSRLTARRDDNIKATRFITSRDGSKQSIPLHPAPQNHPRNIQKRG